MDPDLHQTVPKTQFLFYPLIVWPGTLYLYLLHAICSKWRYQIQIPGECSLCLTRTGITVWSDWNLHGTRHEKKLQSGAEIEWKNDISVIVLGDVSNNDYVILPSFSAGFQCKYHNQYRSPGLRVMIYLFQQDSAPSHMPNMTRDWLTKNLHIITCDLAVLF